jgi:hypothetical protein
LLLGACREAPGDAPRTRVQAVEASEFACDGGRCVQLHVRLPDDGEWRCAERDGVAWCAGGEPAAGVVRAPADRGFVCGTRRTALGGAGERVCVDESPDHPPGERGRYRCRFVQERGTQRECVEERTPVRPVAVRSAPDCWIDADCGKLPCDRGRCAQVKP